MLSRKKTRGGISPGHIVLWVHPKFPDLNSILREVLDDATSFLSYEPLHPGGYILGDDLITRYTCLNHQVALSVNLPEYAIDNMSRCCHFNGHRINLFDLGSALIGSPQEQIEQVRRVYSLRISTITCEVPVVSISQLEEVINRDVVGI